MTVREAYQHWAETYDDDVNLTRDLDQDVTQRVLAHIPASAILELGCGTGKNTAWLAQRGVPLLALDFSPAMLDHARSKVQADHVTFVLADLTQAWNVPDRSVDLIVCNLVLEHIENLDHVFSQAARCLQDGGHFFISELHPFKQYRGTKARYQHDDQQIEITAFIHHISDFLYAAERAGMKLNKLNEWWHEQDQNSVPRLLSLLFVKDRN
ncbi:MAG: class I SAM-dependent methyltransferase [Herpetosiphon sp.]|nr:class I SAM-dependent methyltransferase [Herpetosiphon sp.]